MLRYAARPPGRCSHSAGACGSGGYDGVGVACCASGAVVAAGAEAAFAVAVMGHATTAVATVGRGGEGGSEGSATALAAAGDRICSGFSWAVTGSPLSTNAMGWGQVSVSLRNLLLDMFTGPSAPAVLR